MLKGLPNRREVLAWGSYDLANQSFQLLINTMLFGVYLREVVSDEETGERWWKAMTAAALLAIVALSPILGAIADLRAWKREILLVSGVACAILTATLALVGANDLALAAAIYIPAAILCGVGENFLGSFLPQIADESSMGRVSAIGWTMSYIGALALLICLVIATKVLDLDETADFRWLFLFAGVWFAVWMLPAIVILRERARPTPKGGSAGILTAGFGRLVSTIRGLDRFRVLARFLVVFFIFSMGTQVYVYLSGVITKQLRFNNTDLFLVALELSLLAGLGAMLTGRVQDAWGHRRTIRLFLAIWAVSMGGLAIMAWLGPTRVVFFILAAGTGIGLGGIGTASRALVGVLTPPERAAEFFGLWGMAYKLSGAVAMLLFIALQSLVSGSPAASLGTTAAFFGIGFVLMAGINVEEGVRAAREARAT